MTKMCPIWNHECYGAECMSWDDQHDKCSILFMMECGAWNMTPPYRPQDVRY